MKKLLCEAFCNGLKIRKVPLGYAVSSAYRNTDGDPILFYIVRSSNTANNWRVEDDGTQISLLAALGVNLRRGTRREALDTLLQEYGVVWNETTQIVHSADASEEKIGDIAINFIAFMLRIQDLALLDPQTVTNTFREDALSAIHQHFDSRAIVSENVPVDPGLATFSADVVIKNRIIGRAAPLAIYLATSEEKALQALVLKMEGEKYRKVDSKVVLLVENAKRNPLKETTYALAQARLDGVLSFRGVEEESMMRLGDFMNIEQTLRH